MIAANVAAARFVLKHKRGSLFRVHAPPAAEKVQALREFLNTRGLQLGGGDEPQPADFQAIMEQAAQRPDHYVIQSMMLRTMMQARYSPDCDGHFGLALDEYGHFTSPIRRYPDLVLHRAIKRALRGTPRSEEPLSHQALEALGATCSTTERRADEATRDVALWLKCEYMQQHVGEDFAGTITGVAGFGVFVTLDDIHVEGLVHITALDNDYYEHDAAHGQLVGRRSGRTHEMGDSLRVRVVRVSLDERRIELEPVEATAPSPKKDGRRRRGGGQPPSSSKPAASKKRAVAKKNADNPPADGADVKAPAKKRSRRRRSRSGKPASS